VEKNGGKDAPLASIRIKNPRLSAGRCGEKLTAYLSSDAVFPRAAATWKGKQNEIRAEHKGRAFALLRRLPQIRRFDWIFWRGH
jgi:hypothetical protein